MRPEEGAFEQVCKRVGARCGVNVLAAQAGTVLAVLAAVAMAAVLAERLTAMRVIRAWSVCGSLAVALAAIVGLWRLRRGTPMQVALLIDQRLNLHERFSTTLALAGYRNLAQQHVAQPPSAVIRPPEAGEIGPGAGRSTPEAGVPHSSRPVVLALPAEANLRGGGLAPVSTFPTNDPFVLAADCQTRRLAATLDLAGHFPVRLTRRWYLAAGGWLAVAAVAAFFPQCDVFKIDQRRLAEQRRAELVAQARSDVRQAVEPVKAVVQQIGETSLTGELAKLSEAAPAENARPSDIRRDAIRKLGDLGEKLKQLEGAKGVGGSNVLNEMLKELRGTGPTLRELNKALSAGQMGKAADKARDLAERLRKGELSEPEKTAARRELAELSKRLRDLADKKEKQQSADKAAGAADDSGNASDSKSACKACRGLADQAGKCAGQAGRDGQSLSQDDLDELAKQLDDAESARQLARQLQAGEDAVDEAIARLGRAGLVAGDEEDGEGCDNPGDQEGQLAQIIDGVKVSGPAQAGGRRPTGPDDASKADKKTAVDNPANDGPPIASWLFRGEQVKGESQRKLTETVQAARDRAADAISENRVPKKYESAVKQYFDQLDPSKPAGSPAGDKKPAGE